VGGYRECFGYYGEEADLAIRLQAQGYELMQGKSEYIVHTKSPIRNVQYQMTQGTRNAFYFLLLNVPMPYVVYRVVTYCIGNLRYRFSLRTLPGRTYLLIKGLMQALRHIRDRDPVSRGVYRNFRKLPCHGPDEWDGPVPSPCGS
jgi:hypothetical protein